MVSLVMYESKHKEALENYPLSEEQLGFTGHPIEMLKKVEMCPTFTPVVILDGEQVAVFFVLDTGEDKLNYTDRKEGVLLRGYSVHPSFQGRGIAKSSMKLLPKFVMEYFPTMEQIVLGVNEANKAAQAVYLKNGFIDEGRRYLGSAGIQLALCLKVNQVLVRKAIPGDEQGIVDVCVAAQWNTYKNLYSKEYIEGVIEKFYTVDRIEKEIIETNRFWNGYFVALLNNEIVGAIGGGVDEKGIAEVYVLYLDPEKRNKGIGTKLLNYLSDVQKTKYGAHEQWVSVAKNNMLGIPFYESRGFIFQHEEQSYESKPEDQAISLKYMRKI
ncbi:MAG: GNAT family N-acetyltransferase [Psychrobacillus sp.]